MLDRYDLIAGLIAIVITFICVILFEVLGTLYFPEFLDKIHTLINNATGVN